MSFEPRPRHYMTVFVVSMALLMLEIAIARVLSVALLSHFAFAAISLAMFGLGLSGLAVYLFPNHFRVERLDAQLVNYASLFGLTAALGVPIFLSINLVQEVSVTGFVALSVVYLMLAVPFFFGGVCVSLLMTHGAARIGRIYFADLVGAAAGCLVVIAAMETAPAPVVAVAVGAAACVMATLFALAVVPQQRLFAAALAVAALAILIVGVNTNALRIFFVKGWTQGLAPLERWNSFSRVTAFHSPNLNAAQFLPLDQPTESYKGDAYPQTMVLDIDGTAWTPMMNFDGDFSRIEFLRGSLLYAPHHLRPSADVLIIGTGGGRDILAAKLFRQRSILGIELNPLMRRIVQEDYGAYSGRPYTLPNVEVIVDEARSRLSTLDRRFDVVQLSLIDTFSLNASGGMVFSENYLYTRQAFQQYFRHLKDDGILTVTRYYTAGYPLEVLRLAGLARAAWEAEGAERPADSIVILGQAMDFSVIAKRTPYTAEELAQLDALAAQNHMRVLYRPGMAGEGFASVGTLLTTDDFSGFVEAHPFLIGPPTDDQPFFFHLLRGRLAPADIPDASTDSFQFMRKWSDAIALMYLLVAVVTALALVFFIGPLALTSRQRLDFPPLSIALPLLLYFACLGYGFMMIEIPILQTFILFLGYPVYALAVVLLALLLWSGIGSLISVRLAADLPRALVRVLAAIVILGAAYLAFLPTVIHALLGVSVPLRIAATAILLAPMGLVLGMAYPLGITVLRGYAPDLVPWAWGLNGALSVVASVLAVFIGSRFGFSMAFLTGLAAYGVGLVVMVVLPRAAAAPMASRVVSELSAAGD
jgi:spermidine synthase